MMRAHRGGLSPVDALLTRAAVFAMAGAGAIHLAAVYDHWNEWRPSGVFMFVAGFVQLIWIAWVANDVTPRKLIAGAAGNAGFVAVWLATRTIGLPFGPMAGVAEEPHMPDLVATGLEVLFVVAAAGMLIDRAPRPARRLMALAIAGVALAAIGAGEDALRERLTVMATLSAVGLAAVVSVAFSHVHVTRLIRRSNAKVANIRPAAGARDGSSRTVVVAGGSDAVGTAVAS